MLLLEDMYAHLNHLIKTQQGWEYLVTSLTAACMAILQHANTPFLFLFAFRYLRLLVHIIAFWLYRPAPIPNCRSVTEKDVSVIIPTVEPDNPDFTECLASVLENHPAAIHIVTVGTSKLHLTKAIVAPFCAAHPDIAIHVSATNIANKRQQVAHALPNIRTAITVLVDDHVFWPSTNFLRTAIAPFENPAVGAVGTNKRVRRANTPFGFASFWNVLGALYLERHNFEIRATNTVDGGVFVLSGRTCAYRTEILQDAGFLAGYVNERFFFGKFGPLNADDDNYITRQVVSRGWKIKIQYTEDSMIGTTLGVSGYRKFLSQCLRWVRTTWRSNSASLFTDRTVWRSQSWCVYAVYLTSFVNFALFYDAALFLTLMRTDFSSPNALKALGMWIFVSEMVKITPYFLRHPTDLVYLPGYFAFAYFHSLIKLYAGLTFWVTAWGGRDLEKINQVASGQDDGHVDSSGTSSSISDQDSDYYPAGMSESSSGCTSSPTMSAWSSGRATPLPLERRAISTPWGLVSPDNKHMPANILLDQRALTSRRQQRRWEDSTKQSHGDVDELLQQQDMMMQQNPPRLSLADAGHGHASVRAPSYSPITPQQLLTPELSVKAAAMVSPHLCFFESGHHAVAGTHGHSYNLRSGSSREASPAEYARTERYFTAYCRDWSRAACGRLHYDGRHMDFGECELKDSRFDN